MSTVAMVPIFAYPPVVWRSASMMMGRPCEGTCTAPNAMPSEMMSDPFLVSISGPSRRYPMRSHFAVVV